MPFTLSHAVVALPFARTPLVPAAIAIGAMTPDLPLFARGMWPDYSMTHDPTWVPITTVVALVLFLVWRCVLRPAVRELSPRVIADRLPDRWDAGFRDGLRESFRGGVGALLWLIVSLALGVVTHIAWDLFTHEGRLGVELMPFLDQQWGPLPGVKWLQHASSVLGLVILTAYGLLWVSRRGVAPVRRVLPDAVRVIWWVSLPAALVIGGVIAVVATASAGTVITPTALVYAVLTRIAAAWAIASVLLALTVQVRRRAQIRGIPGS
ncbi:DUF4184 family protein [Microbacterium enclense]|uniref:DUF4184 family protein n=1 Tax=Microbacterium enclense TaxID=993073 RepID=A0A3S3KTV4_9MICO|nr:DUF4184 family protein [Microbacterium enclense]RWR15635.1 DUF4184 family protein [Microbacterium enclense]